MKTPETIEWIRKVFNDPSKTIIFHNAKFDLKMFSFEGIDIFNMKATVDCTLILAKIYNCQMWEYDLRWLGIQFLGRDPGAKDEIVEWLRRNKARFVAEHGREPGFQDAPYETVKRRAIWDVETTLLLHARLRPLVEQASPELYSTERDLMFVVVDMENHGVKVDLTRAKLLRNNAQRAIDMLHEQLNALVCPLVIQKNKNGKIKEEIITEFNPNSTATQLPAAFEKLGITLKFRTKAKKSKRTGQMSGGGRWSFDEYAMIRYVSPHLAAIIRDSGEEGWEFQRWWREINETIRAHQLDLKELLPPLVLKVNELTKLVNTYYTHLIEDAVDVHFEPSGREVGIIHGSFNQSEAMTGRFSSSGPNLQNMPRILGPRECFIPRLGRRNWHFDYEQVEMKFFVHFAEDDDMARAIADDIHLYVAAEIYDRPAEDVTKEQRKRAKGVNFGILYGAGPPTMAETLTKKGLITTTPEASLLVAKYHKRFPSVRRTTSKFKSELHRDGYVRNPFGRRYHIPSKFSYKALNYMCQGTSADLMKLSMVRIWKYLRAVGAKSRIILTVHDELAIEMPLIEEKTLIPEIKRLMEDRKSFYIPITVDCEVVTHRWSEKKKAKDVGLIV